MHRSSRWDGDLGGRWLPSEARLEEENQGLRQQLDQMGELAAENERLSNLVAQASSSRSLSEDQMRELLRLRAEVATLRQHGNAPASSPNENSQAPTSAESAAPTTNYWPRASWAFAGYATRAPPWNLPCGRRTRVTLRPSWAASPAMRRRLPKQPSPSNRRAKLQPHS